MGQALLAWYEDELEQDKQVKARSPTAGRSGRQEHGLHPTPAGRREDREQEDAAALLSPLGKMGLATPAPRTLRNTRSKVG